MLIMNQHYAYWKNKYPTMAAKFKTIPVLMVPIPKHIVASEYLYSVRETLLETFDYEPECSVHSVPSGGTVIRIECKSHEETALLEFFNVLDGGWRL